MNNSLLGFRGLSRPGPREDTRLNAAATRRDKSPGEHRPDDFQGFFCAYFVHERFPRAANE